MRLWHTTPWGQTREKGRMEICLTNLHISHTYVPLSLSSLKCIELCLFSDSSNTAIAAVAYLWVFTEEGLSHVGFVLGKAKLAPHLQPTIPRLELCAAVLTVEIAEIIIVEIDFEPDAVKFYCDSKVVLGYIFKETRRFFVDVHNRMQRIHQSTVLEQWHFIPTNQNTEDIATRSIFFVVSAS